LARIFRNAETKVHFTMLSIYSTAIVGLLCSYVLAAPAPHSRDSVATSQELFNIPGISIENIARRSNGHLLFSTVGKGQLYSTDPLSVTPEPLLVTEIPGVNTLTGIAQVGRDVFAVTGAVYHPDSGFEPGTLKVSVVNFGSCAVHDDGSPTVTVIVEGVNSTSSLNGMASLPQHPHIVLSAGSETGEIWRTDTATGVLDMAFQDDMLTVGPPGMLNIGVNGLKIRGDYLYFTNTNRKIFGRVKIDDLGSKVGDVEIIYQFPSNATVALDDFALDKAGNAYLAAWAGTLHRITLEGKETIVLNHTLVNPTSASFGENDATLYVVTSGQSVEPVTGGQLIKVEL
jgi:hypothetical protein